MIITTSEVKSIMQISGKDDAISSIIPFAEEHAIDYTKNPFHISGQYVEGYQISFSSSNKKIINAEEDFISEGNYPIRFQAGLMIHVQNSILNDGFFTIAAVDGKNLTVSSNDVLFDEASGTFIRIDLVKVSKGFKLALARYIGLLLDGAKLNFSSESLGDWSGTRNDQFLAQCFSGYRKIGVV